MKTAIIIYAIIATIYAAISFTMIYRKENSKLKLTVKNVISSPPGLILAPWKWYLTLFFLLPIFVFLFQILAPVHFIMLIRRMVKEYKSNTLEAEGEQWLSDEDEMQAPNMN